MSFLSFLNHDPQAAGPQYLEDLATGYWYSEVLFSAVELGIFSLLHPSGLALDEIAAALGLDTGGAERFLNALCALGLISADGTVYYNTRISSEYLVENTETYQGDSILWRKQLAANWQDLNSSLKAGGRVHFDASCSEPSPSAQIIRKYISAMDRVARTKVREMLTFFEGLSMEGEILDAGAGSGAVASGFLEHFPAMTATLLDLPEVLAYTRELLSARGYGERVCYCPANILEPWPVPRDHFSLIILSNIIHAYSGQELPVLLNRAADALKPDGILLVHDFFFDHYPEKAALFDLNMLINTYNGRVFSSSMINAEMARLNLHTTGLVPLTTDTAVVFAGKDKQSLAGLSLDRKSRLTVKIKNLGFRQARIIATENIHIPDWTDLRCQFGCDHYGQPHCPPHSPAAGKTREVLTDYTCALLLEGEPPTDKFQHLVLRAEKEAFMAGFHKTLAYWAGPCTICPACSGDGVCHNPRNARPSMEGAGIDVYETVRRAGLSIRTLTAKDEFIKYFALLLLE